MIHRTTRPRRKGGNMNHATATQTASYLLAVCMATICIGCPSQLNPIPHDRVGIDRDDTIPNRDSENLFFKEVNILCTGVSPGVEVIAWIDGIPAVGNAFTFQKGNYAQIKFIWSESIIIPPGIWARIDLCFLFPPDAIEDPAILEIIPLEIPQNEGEGEEDDEGEGEGLIEGEGETEGSLEGEGEGAIEGSPEGEGEREGASEGEGAAEGEGEDPFRVEIPVDVCAWNPFDFEVEAVGFRANILGIPSNTQVNLYGGELFLGSGYTKEINGHVLVDIFLPNGNVIRFEPRESDCETFWMGFMVTDPLTNPVVQSLVPLLKEDENEGEVTSEGENEGAIEGEEEGSSEGEEEITLSIEPGVPTSYVTNGCIPSGEIAPRILEFSVKNSSPKNLVLGTLIFELGYNVPETTYFQLFIVEKYISQETEEVLEREHVSASGEAELDTVVFNIPTTQLPWLNSYLTGVEVAKYKKILFRMMTSFHEYEEGDRFLLKFNGLYAFDPSDWSYISEPENGWGDVQAAFDIGCPE